MLYMRVLFLMADSNGGFPVPAVKGGATETLVEHLIKQNQKKQLVDMEIVSFYDKDAVKAAEQYTNCQFHWIRIPVVVKMLDKLLYFIVKHFFKKKKAVSYKTIFSLLYYILCSSHIIKQCQYDKIILENNIPLAWTIKLSKFNGEYYYHFHNVPRISAKAKETIQNSTGFLCVSCYVADQICKPDNAIGPVNKDKTRVLYNCIDLNHFSPRSKETCFYIREKYGVSKEETLIIFVGRLSKEKGIDVVLSAMKQCKTKHIKLMIVGGLMPNDKEKDQYQLYIRKLAAEMGDNVIFTGYIDQAALPDFYGAADLAILPSMWDEPAGLTMVEAMAEGLPVISTVSGGIPEYLGNAAVLLQRDDDIVSRLAENIDKIITSFEVSNIMREAGVKRAAFIADSETYLERFLQAISR